MGERFPSRDLPCVHPEEEVMALLIGSDIRVSDFCFSPYYELLMVFTKRYRPSFRGSPQGDREGAPTDMVR